MFNHLVTSTCFLFVASGLTVKQSDTSQPVHDYEVSETGHIETTHHGGFLGKVIFGPGSGLKTIAQGSAEQANNAVANQHAAARQAAFAAKSSLAQAAAGSAATAQAALIGKYILVQKLEYDVNEAHSVLQGELHQLELAEKSALSAQTAANQAQQAANAIGTAANAAQGTAAHTQQAAEEISAELGTQQAMVGHAKQRLSRLTEELHAAQADLHVTQEASQRADASAQLAQSNAAQAAHTASGDGLEHVGGDSIGISVEGLTGYHHH